MIGKMKRLCGAYLSLTREYFRLLAGAGYDFLRYARFAIIGYRRKRLDRDSLEALLIKEYHVVEKGLSMPDFRPRFGIPRVHYLISLMERYLTKASGQEPGIHFESALKCLTDYRERHAALGIRVDDVVDAGTLRRFADAVNADESAFVGGVRPMSPDTLFAARSAPFAEFAASRTSCRHFDAERAVDPTILDKAVETALRTPSVCNRQAWRLHSFHRREEIDRLLSHQNGNRGFGMTIPCLLVVTADLACFDGPIERYQAWIDGGMFGMMVLLGLHHEGLGAVPLNWSVMPAEDRSLRQAAGIPDPESIIMLIGAGHPVDEFLVPVSLRRKVREIHHVHKSL